MSVNQDEKISNTSSRGKKSVYKIELIKMVLNFLTAMVEMRRKWGMISNSEGNDFSTRILSTTNQL